MDNRLIVFSKWCDHLPLPELARNVKTMGFAGLDLPCRQSSAITHASAPEKLPEAKRILEDHGLSLERLVCDIVSEDDNINERFLTVLRELDIRKIRAGDFSVPPGTDIPAAFDAARKRLETIEKLLEKFEISAGIQNHSGDGLEVNISSTLRILQDRNPKWLGIQYDPGHLTLSGENPHIALGLMGPYLHSVNFKSPRQEYFVAPQTGRMAYVSVWGPLQSGMLDVPCVLKALKEVGYKDAISIHCEYRSYFHRMENDLEGTNRLATEDAAYIREVSSSIP